MKKLFLFACAAVTFASCNNSETSETTTEDTAVVLEQPAPAVVATYSPKEGDVTYVEGKAKVHRSGAWVDADDDVRYDNGVVVYRDGRATRDGNEVQLEDGYTVDRDGNVWDRTGNAVSDAWDATKHGVKKAAKAVGNAAEKVGEKAKDAVD